MVVTRGRLAGIIAEVAADERIKRKDRLARYPTHSRTD
jgi:hypothetical protein